MTTVARGVANNSLGGMSPEGTEKGKKVKPIKKTLLVADLRYDHRL
jgi:hypothetical protein